MKNGLNRLQRRTSTDRRIITPPSRLRGAHRQPMALRLVGGSSFPTKRVLGEASRRVSPEIALAMEKAAEARSVIASLEKLQSDTVRNLVGVPREELCVMLWIEPLALVARRLRMDPRVLKRVCTLYEVPTPAQGYWSTRPDRRSIRTFKV